MVALVTVFVTKHPNQSKVEKEVYVSLQFRRRAQKPWSGEGNRKLADNISLSQEAEGKGKWFEAINPRQPTLVLW